MFPISKVIGPDNGVKKPLTVTSVVGLAPETFDKPLNTVRLRIGCKSFL